MYYKHLIILIIFIVSAGCSNKPMFSEQLYEDSLSKKLSKDINISKTQPQWRKYQIYPRYNHEADNPYSVYNDKKRNRNNSDQSHPQIIYPIPYIDNVYKYKYPKYDPEADNPYYPPGEEPMFDAPMFDTPLFTN